MKPQKFYSNGKLLITGEYLVLDGALALAVPTSYGQSLTIAPDASDQIHWESFDPSGKLWLKALISPKNGMEILNASDPAMGKQLLDIFRAIQKQRPDFLKDGAGFKIKTDMDFPRSWGLGSSSTLINNLAQWAKIDPYKLLQSTFGGSGYDIACAMHNTPITYQLERGGRTIIERAFRPDFRDHLYFVHLNKKQNSRDGIAAYRKQSNNNSWAFSEIDAITNDMLSCTSLETFQFLMQSHETIISRLLAQTPVKALVFNDFNGSIKSLGAWGGDFILVACETNPETYFSNKGYETIIPYDTMVL